MLLEYIEFFHLPLHILQSHTHTGIISKPFFIMWTAMGQEERPSRIFLPCL